MKIFCQISLSLIIYSCLLINPVYADNLGRIYTSLDERNQLEKIRSEKPKVKKIEVSKIEESIDSLVLEKELVVRDAITLKGLVHRSDGKSTAWINDSNTFEGDLESQFIQVPDNKIKTNKVTIILPDDSTHVELRVGEAFIPAPLEKDIVDTVNSVDDR